MGSIGGSDTFEDFLKDHLRELEGKLVTEHKLALEKAETRARANSGFSHERAFSVDRHRGSEDQHGKASLSDHLPGSVLRNLSGQEEATSGKGACQRLGGKPEDSSGVQEFTKVDEGSKYRDGSVHDCWDSDDQDKSSPYWPGPADDSDAGTHPDDTGQEAPHFQVLDTWLRPKVNSVHTVERMPSGAHLLLFDDEQSDEEEEEGGCISTWLVPYLVPFMVSPSSWQYLCWELTGLLLIAHDIVTIPLQLLRPPDTTFTVLMSWTIRIFWTLDVFMSFVKGFVSPQGLLEVRPVKVFKQYVRSRLCFDLVLISCDWMEPIIANIRGGRGNDTLVLRLLGMLRGIRLARPLRLARSQRISEFIFERIRSEGVMLVAYIVAIMFLLLCLVHVVACIWYAINVGNELVDDLHASYFQAFHFVLALFAGEMLQEPSTLVQRIFVIIVLIMALVVSAAFVGSLTTAMTRLQIIASKRSTQFAALSHYLSDYGISRELAARVHRNARHALQEQKRHIPESSVELMTLISDPLRSEIHYEVFSPILNTHPFFQLYSGVNPVGVRHVCHTALQSVLTSRGDVIFSEHELPSTPRMIFIRSGKLIYARGLEPNQFVTAGDWVAEAVLWTNWIHRGTLRALVECRLLAVNAPDFMNIMVTFPSSHGAEYAKTFVESLNQTEYVNELTDLSIGEEQTRQMAANVFNEVDKQLKYSWKSAGRRVGSIAARRLHNQGGARGSAASRTSVGRNSASRNSIIVGSRNSRGSLRQTLFGSVVPQPESRGTPLSDPT